MPLQFIFGNSGSGKTHYLYQHVIEESMKHPQMNYLILVPEQFTMQTQRDLCMMHPCGGIMNIDVLSFGRLAYRIFEETGANSRHVLDDEGKNLILRKIAADYEDELRILRGNLKKQGYISEVKSVISEFTQYGIGFEELDEFMEHLEPTSPLYFKLQDIRRLYEEFEKYLADRYITKEELLDVLSDAVPQSELLKKSVVVLDGFTGFTPIQNRLLGELMKSCKKVMITVVMDEREDPFTFRHPYQLFALSKQMVTGLVKIAGELWIPIEEHLELYGHPLPRFRNNPELDFLEANLFRSSMIQYSYEPVAVSLHTVRNPKAEADFVASQIRKLVREQGYRYRDIAVISSEMNVYASHFETSFDSYQIPVFMDHKKSILLNAFVDYLRCLLGMVSQGFTYDSVFRFLRTGLTEFAQDEVDLLDNYVRALGIRGYKKWQQAWVRKTRDTEGEKLELLNGMRVRFVEKIDALVLILRQHSKTVKDITVAVYEYLVKEQMQERLKEWETRLQDQGELALSKEYSQIYRIVIELFDKFVELLGDEKIALSDYCELLDAGLEEARVGVIPPSLDQVVIGDVQRTRIKNVKALFFVGANDSLLPGKMKQGGLLSEKEREHFQKQNLSLTPGAKEQIYIQQFYLYMNLTKPEEHLYITYSKVSADGQSLRPAYLIPEFRKLYPSLKVIDEEIKGLKEREITPKTGLSILAAGLSDRRCGLDNEWKELYSWYKKDAKEMNIWLNKLLDAGFFNKESSQLSAADARFLYGDEERVSVTRLERFATCAYNHFLTYGLKLKEREEYQFEAMDLGNIAHQAMERFSIHAETLGDSWTEMDEEVRAKLVEQSVEESIVDYGNTVLYSTSRNEYMVSRIKKLIYRSVWALTAQMEKSDFKPAEYELKFGSGKIDRVDICEDADKIFVKVTDYKTGSKSFDITSFYYGLQMQLPVYLNAAVDWQKEKQPAKEIIPAGFFYFRMKDPIVDKEKDETALETRILKELKLDGLVNVDDGVIDHLERDLNGASNFIPVGKNKDGSFRKDSKVLEAEDFLTLLEYTRKKSASLKSSIFSGEVDAAPYVLGKDAGCDYCGYRDICGFDQALEGYESRNFEKYSQEEVVEKMKQELGSSKKEGA